MSSWSIVHRVRYPPFDDKRLNANAAPIFEDEIASKLNDSDVLEVLPPYTIQSSEGWLIERCIVDENGESLISVTSYKPKEMAHNYETFCYICEIWRRSEGYDPRKECS